MIWLALVIGFLGGWCVPTQFKTWVLGAGRAARDRVLRSPAPDAPPVTVAQASKNVITGLARICAFCWRYKLALLALAIFIMGASVLRGCSIPFADIGKSRGQIALEREIAEGEVETQKTINKRDGALDDLADELEAIRREIRYTAEQGRNEIEAARPTDEAPIDPGVVAAWRSSLDRLCVPRADGSRADSCGPSA